MDLRNVGRSGLRVSAVGLGCNNFGLRIDLESSRKVVRKALDLGVTLFDTADSYGNVGGSENILGQTLGERRKDVVLATKFGRQLDNAGMQKGASRPYILSAVEASLRRLRTDWIDLYQLHVPDPLTPIEETLRTLEDLIRQGKVRYIGCSNLSAWQVVEAQWTARHLRTNGFISSQHEYSLIARKIEGDAIPALTAHSVALLPFFPLASGLLTGKYRREERPPEGTRFKHLPHLAERYLTESNWRAVQQLEAFCAHAGRRMLEIAFGWLLAKPLVASVIAGATTPEQVEQNVAAAAERPLTFEELAEIDRLTAPA